MRLFTASCVVIAAVVLASSLWPTVHRSSIPAPILDALSKDLATITIIDTRPRVVGYKRELFGAGWGSSLDPDSGAYCSTREHVLAHTLGYTGCKPPTDDGASAVQHDHGVAHDPFTGRVLDPHNIDIDHIVPLAAAWDLGAWSWDAPTRHRFANDRRLNLVAVDSAVNRDKSDATLSQWMPPDPAAHCAYAARFVRIIASYDLALPRRDADVARQACGL